MRMQSSRREESIMNIFKKHYDDDKKKAIEEAEGQLRWKGNILDKDLDYFIRKYENTKILSEQDKIEIKALSKTTLLKDIHYRDKDVQVVRDYAISLRKPKHERIDLAKPYKDPYRDKNHQSDHLQLYSCEFQYAAI